MRSTSAYNVSGPLVPGLDELRVPSSATKESTRRGSMQEARTVLHATRSIGSISDSFITYVTVEGAGELWHEPVWKFPKSQG